MSYADERPGYKISTRDEVRNAILEAVDLAEEAQRAVTILVPNPESALAQTQRKNYVRLMMLHGSALGMIVMAHRLGKIDDVLYHDLRNRANAVMAPRIVGSV